MTGDVLLIDARSIGLSVPVISPKDRSILSNPSSLLSDFYFGNTVREPQALLSDISFKLHTGEKLAVIGSNGAGKSTLLRLLGGIYQPTQGNLSLKCTPRGLFDVAVGFVGEATGLENIYLRGLEMGLSMSAIRALIPQDHRVQ